MTHLSVDPQDPDRELESFAKNYRHASGAAPPAAVDAAVLAHAREAARRRSRAPIWWVPATLAATVLIALSLVMRVQQESAPMPAVGENAVPVPPERHDAGASAVPDRREPRVAADKVQQTPEPPRLRAAEPVQPRADGPVVSAPSAAAAVESARLEEVPAVITAKGAATRTLEAPATSGAPRSQASAKDDALPGPEAWLARIEALESAGRLEEAAAERARLEAAYPGWLAQHARERD